MRGRRSRAQLNAISRAYSEKTKREAREALAQARAEGLEVEESKLAAITLRRIYRARKARQAEEESNK